MHDSIWTFLMAKWAGFTAWLTKVFSIEMGDKKRWPGIINLIPGVTKGYDIASSGEALALVFVRDYVVGTVKLAWSKLTQVPSYLFSPIFSFNDSGYSWTTLILNTLHGLGARLRGLLAFLWGRP